MKTGIEAFIRRIQKDIEENGAGCEHFEMIEVVTPNSTAGCEECLRLGDSWVHLRLCLSCGHVGCCDSSKNKHARQHYHQTMHGMVLSYEPDEAWFYCYVDDQAYILPD
jgi:uncharacterized UBP type Zn finger protein